MTRNRTLFWAGLLTYTASFALFAVACRDPCRDLIRGYNAAILTLVIPWQENPFSVQWIFHDQIFDYVAILISGWINPLFLITVILVLLRRYQ